MNFFAETEASVFFKESMLTARSGRVSESLSFFTLPDLIAERENSSVIPATPRPIPARDMRSS